MVVSPLNMIASACSKTALATSVISARVGNGFVIIDSSIWVATMTGLPSEGNSSRFALDDRQLLHRAFDSQIAARDHDDVGGFRSSCRLIAPPIDLRFLPRSAPYSFSSPEVSQLFDVALLAQN